MEFLAEDMIQELSTEPLLCHIVNVSSAKKEGA